MGLLTLWVPSNQTRLAKLGSSGSTLLPETVTVKDCLSFTDFIDRTLGETLNAESRTVTCKYLAFVRRVGGTDVSDRSVESDGERAIISR
ncbi:hypothetical protein F2Q68_00022060 [Brassica cretica]|uniref:Uncharacterized protein n=2 Tax=Brassica cretica TaxID=69181 RepID=A0A8S9FT51_BRACR|nr:hypothetical protein F2Q68_00022060 [Brassica cretica]KAF3569566.1 hypothetical protein DY000_02017851 [Brassica cretica]